MKFKERVFAPGPTPIPVESRLTMAERNPYHRTEEFSEVISDVSSTLGDLARVDWPVIPVSASGTGAMQMAVNNTVEPSGQAMVIESGKFGERWTRILRDRNTDVEVLEVPWGEAVDPDTVGSVLSESPGVDVVFGTLVETSTLVRHPVNKIGKAIGDQAYFAVDAISGFGAELFRPDDWNVDLFVGGSQKGLMAPPGLSLIGCTPEIVERSESIPNRGTYFDLPTAVDTLECDRQTPWTPPMNLLRSLEKSLRQIQNEGMESVLNRHETLAEVCRKTVRELGLTVFPDEPSNIGTAVKVPEEVDAEQLRDVLRRDYELFLPGGQKHLNGKLVRIGHLGNVDYFDLLTILGSIEQGLIDLGILDGPVNALKKAQSVFRKIKDEQ